MRGYKESMWTYVGMSSSNLLIVYAKALSVGPLHLVPAPFGSQSNCNFSIVSFAGDNE